MRNILLGIVLIMSLAACQQESPEVDQSTDESTPSSNQDENKVEDSTEGENAESEDDSNQESLNDDQYMAEKMSSLDFYEFELEVEYADGREYEAEIEQDSQKPYKAEIEDQLNNIYLKGLDAFNNIFERIEQLSVSSTSDHEDVIQQVLDLFELPNDYVEFELELDFNDGSEL